MGTKTLVNERHRSKPHTMQACSCSSSSAAMLRRAVLQLPLRAQQLQLQQQHSALRPVTLSLQQVRTGATKAARIPELPAGSSGEHRSVYFKTFKPLTPSLRHVRQPVHPHLHKGKPERKLTVAKRGTGGRNNTGRITTRFRGGGHRRRIRLVDFKRQTEGPQTVIRIEYDPGRSAHIALIKHNATEELTYILAPEGLRAGDTVQSWPRGVSVGESGSSSTDVEESSSSSSSNPSTSLNVDPSAPQSTTIGADSFSNMVGQPEALATSLQRASMLKPGNQLPLHLIPTGTTVHCISLQPGLKGALCRSAGSYGKIVALTSAGSKGGQYAQIQLQSGEVRKLNRNCTAVIGSVSNREHQNKVIGKAGRNRWLGWKPRVRGVAMNAVDHPHGGGRGKSKGNKHPRTPQGKLTKGKRTRRPGPAGNRFVVKQRPRGKEASRK